MGKVCRYRLTEHMFAKLTSEFGVLTCRRCHQKLRVGDDILSRPRAGISRRYHRQCMDAMYFTDETKLKIFSKFKNWRIRTLKGRIKGLTVYKNYRAFVIVLLAVLLVVTLATRRKPPEEPEAFEEWEVVDHPVTWHEIGAYLKDNTDRFMRFGDRLRTFMSDKCRNWGNNLATLLG